MNRVVAAKREKIIALVYTQRPVLLCATQFLCYGGPV
jgi:hypothetical protein